MELNSLPDSPNVNEESFRLIIPSTFLSSAVPPRIEKLNKERAELIKKLIAVNTELVTLETLNLINTNGNR
jgi:hypothetical protein